MNYHCLLLHLRCQLTLDHINLPITQRLKMTVDSLISDPSLQPLLKTTQAALAQTQALLDWLSSNLSSSSPPSRDLQLQLSQQQKLLHVSLTKLRTLHRRSALGVRATKQSTANARHEVDRLLLQLQNLYYEQKHLLGEIGACEGYDHSYMRLPLVSREEYVGLFPEEEGVGEEELMPRRIEHERVEREKMEEERARLVEIKEGLLRENGRKKDELRKMDERLEALVDGLRPLEEALLKEL